MRLALALDDGCLAAHAGVSLVVFEVDWVLVGGCLDVYAHDFLITKQRRK